MRIKKTAAIAALPLAALLLTGCEADEASATPETDDAQSKVTAIVDGDTIAVDGSMVRLIGIDTPERGQCGYEEAKANVARIAPIGSVVQLFTSPGTDDKDKYSRLLRYVQTERADLGMSQITAGLAIARYDSRDGYSAHPKQDEYILADESTPNLSCAPPTPTPTPTQAAPAPAPAPTKAAPAPKPTTQAPAPEPEAPAAVSYANCAAVKAAGAAPIRVGDPGYSTKLDRDKDGVACEN